MGEARNGKPLFSALRHLFGSGVTGAAATQSAKALKSRTQRAAVPVGRFRLVGLSHIRDELGPRWPALADRVYSLAESVISRHLLAGDVFDVNDDGDFVVLFCQLSEREAEFKARAIGREITRRLLGSQWRTLSSIETGFSSIARSALDGDDLDAALAAAFDKGGRFLSSHEDEPRTDGEVADVGASAAAAAAPGAAPSSIARTERIGRPPPDWAYAPIWDFSHGALIYFRIVPGAGHRHAGLTGAALVQSQFAADLAALNKASADLIVLAALGRRLPIVCPLHGGSLEYPTRRREFLEALREQPTHVRRLLTIELTAPPDWPRSRALGEFIEVVGRLTGGVWSRLPAQAGALLALGELPGVVTIQLPSRLVSEASYIRFLEAFAARTRRTETMCGVAGLASRSLVVAASAAGFSYMSGPIIHPEIATLDQATRFDFAQLYADLLPA